MAVLVTTMLGLTAFAVDLDNLPAGEYAVGASLSCYVNAMGGVVFGAPLLRGATLIVDGGGNRTLKLALGKSSVTIYGVTCDTFVDTSPSYQTDDRGVKSGTIGFYDGSGALRTAGVTHTLSQDTALNASNESVHYVDSISFPLSQKNSEYRLTLYINSNVMGVQFCEKNDKATATTYQAVLTVNWDSLAADMLTAAASGAEKSAAANTGDASANSAAERGASGNTSGADIGGHGATVVEEEGLDIHYAGGKPASTEPSYTAYLNVKMLIIVAICAGVLIAAGIALLACTGKKGAEEGAAGK
jgi:hypothetical protein